ncbi:hypothetical protein V6N12_005986 [Hibiscus sabdariffa]|uniref:AP180 N-terminal homology (ANTH) domain-containing protein n=1 Tax=Hibiscus sabdariffa TaxID=183260 RepID=A0ABR2EWN4_9ROSI
MGRLPFDLSSFNDGHSRLSKTWGYDVFNRQYFAFLDERGAIWFNEENRNAGDGPLMVQKLLKIRKWQFLLDMLLKIRPQADNMKVCLIFEAMDRVEELERIINGASDNNDSFKEKNQMALVVREEHSAIVEHRETKETLKTTITDKWEVFDDDVNIHGDNVNGYFNENNTAEVRLDSDQPLIPVEHVAVINPFEIPDLISF